MIRKEWVEGIWEGREREREREKRERENREGRTILSVMRETERRVDKEEGERSG